MTRKPGDLPERNADFRIIGRGVPMRSTGPRPPLSGTAFRGSIAPNDGGHDGAIPVFSGSCFSGF